MSKYQQALRNTKKRPENDTQNPPSPEHTKRGKSKRKERAEQQREQQEQTNTTTKKKKKNKAMNLVAWLPQHANLQQHGRRIVQETVHRRIAVHELRKLSFNVQFAVTGAESQRCCCGQVEFARIRHVCALFLNKVRCVRCTSVCLACWTFFCHRQSIGDAKPRHDVINK